MLVLVLYSNLNGSDVGDGCVVGIWLDRRTKKWYTGFGFILIRFHDDYEEAMISPTQCCCGLYEDAGNFPLKILDIR